MNWPAYQYLLAMPIVALVLLLIVGWRSSRLTQESERRTPDEVVLLLLLCCFGLFLVYGNFYLGKAFFAYGNGDVGSDTLNQYIPFYVNLVDRVRTGTLSAWTFDFGLGVSLPSFQSWLYDPFNLFVVPAALALGEGGLGLVLVASQSLKILLAALLFDHFLTRFLRVPLSRVVGSLLYAFCGFMVMFGQHYWLGSAFPVFTLVMLLFELYLERTGVVRFVLLALTVGLLMAWSPYIAFMVLMFAVFYLLLRIPSTLEHASVGSYLATIARLVVPVACGLLLSGAIFVPYASFLLGETSRTTSSLSLTEKVASYATLDPIDWFPAILSRLLGTGLLNTGATVENVPLTPVADIEFSAVFPYEFIQLGFTGATLLLLSQFLHWTFSDCPVAHRVPIVLGSLLVVLYCSTQLPPTLLAGMTKFQFRSAFVLALPLCLAMAAGFEQRVIPGRVSRIPLVLAGLATVAILVWSLVNTINGRLVCLYFLAASALVFFLLFRMDIAGSRHGAALAVVACAIASMSFVDAFFVTNSRGYVSADVYPPTSSSEAGQDTRDALAYLASIDQDFYRVDKTYADWTPLNDSLIQHFAGVSCYNSTPDSDVEALYQMLWPESIMPWAVCSQGLQVAPNSPEMLQLLDVKYILSKGEVDFPWCELLTRKDTVYVYRNTLASSIATVRQAVSKETEASALASAQERRMLTASAVIVEDEAYDAANATLAGASTSSATSSFAPAGTDALLGTIDCASNSVVCLALPYTDTWEVRVDGQPVETFRANYGCVGFALPSGSHEIQATYHLAGLGIGAIVSAVGLALTIISCVVISRRS